MIRHDVIERMEQEYEEAKARNDLNQWALTHGLALLHEVSRLRKGLAALQIQHSEACDYRHTGQCRCEAEAINRKIAALLEGQHMV